MITNKKPKLGKMMKEEKMTLVAIEFKLNKLMHTQMKHLLKNPN